MQRQTLIALGVALVLGLVAVFLANTFLTSTQKRADMATAGMTKVAVAGVPLDYGMELTPDKVRFINLPTASLPPGSYRSLSELLPTGKKRVALMHMAINEPILSGKVTGEGQNASLASLLPDGKRAVAVRINDVSGVAGFIQPNDSVDVLITRQVIGADRDAQVTDVLLQDVRVIAIDQDAKGDDSKPVVAKTATLEVDPVDAQKLALAQGVGTLNLVLRKPGEQQNNPIVETVSLEDLRYNVYGGTRYAQPAKVSFAAPPAAPLVPLPTRRVVRAAAPVVAKPKPAGDNIEVFRGMERSSYEVSRHGS